MGLVKDIFYLRKEGQRRKARGRSLNAKYKARTCTCERRMAAPRLWFPACEFSLAARSWERLCPVTFCRRFLARGWLARVPELTLGSRLGWVSPVTCRDHGTSVGLAAAAWGFWRG